ncbi:fimbrial protein [Pantoea agglomerans]|uniref:fimbrial protein n=1 Tax=Enterobacter agglomerans TaxID=549 RepID=UPI003DA084FB
MKKTLIALSLICAPVMFAQAADGTINFTGNITDAACTVDAASATQTVNLGTVSAKAFTAVGSSAAPTKFSINLTNCPAAVTKASVKFDGLINKTNADLLAVNTDSTATGVGIGIYEADSTTQVPMLTASASKAIDSTAGATNTMNFVAKYIATAATVGAGTANASTDFTVVYN